MPLQKENGTDLTSTFEASKPDIDLHNQKLIALAQHKVDHFKAGQIVNYVHQWKMLTSNPEILDIVQGAYIELDAILKQCTLPMTNDFNQAETKLVTAEIEKLLQKRVIQPCIKESDDFISKYF